MSKADLLIVVWLGIKVVLDVATILYLVFRFGK